MKEQILIYKRGTFEIEFLKRLYNLQKNKIFLLNCGKLKLNTSASYLARIFCMEIKRVKEHLYELNQEGIIKLSKGGIELFYGIRNEN